ncbi:hypothetical protein CA13_06300 [Planctomycetes bacterium CA13]|uniref:Endonuclease/Exonuclease/phosphatase family protein n=1 Tax=Novipirellula herctigrandis TaxID=2527986 RepID=A0A5C5YW08_9BACT|nr:hypothetical protein CA13_06300 [Planctomycetes bacterium CA13]
MGLLFGRSRRRSSRSVFSYIPFIRWIGPLVSVGGIAAACLSVITGRIDLSVLDKWAGVDDETAELAAANGDLIVNRKVPRERSSSTVRIATFNIQMFGDKKSQTRTLSQVPGVDVMGTIASIIRQFDLVAIQDIRSGDVGPVRRMIELVNAEGGTYTGTVSQPIGRSYQDTQCYAFVWDARRIRLLGEPYVVQDSADRMHREPMVGSFATIPVSSDGQMDGGRPFCFTLINANNDPDPAQHALASAEVNVLDDVFVRVRDYEYSRTGIEDYLLVGSLNTGVSGLGELSRIPNVVSVAGDIPTDVRRRETLDHILLDRTMTTEFTGQTGVIDLQRDFGLSEMQAALISDHAPLWAEFSVYESEHSQEVAVEQRMIR